jgi:hypothetical protein
LGPHYSHADLSKTVIDSGILKWTADKSVNEDFVSSLLLPILSAAVSDYRLASLTAAGRTARELNISFARLAATAKGLKTLINEVEGQPPRACENALT